MFMSVAVIVVFGCYSLTDAGIGSIQCPNGRRIVCLIHPCQSPACSNVPGAICRTDYCDGCRARYFNDRTEVTSRCSNVTTRPSGQTTATGSVVCPNGRRFICLIHPCRRRACSNVPGAVCRPDYCDGCIARYFNDGTEVTSRCRNSTGSVTTTPRGQTTGQTCPPSHFPCPGGIVFACCINPCQFSSCANFPNAVCRSDYCGGCRARFFTGCTEVTSTCSPSPQANLNSA